MNFAPFYAFSFARGRRCGGEFTPAVVDVSSRGISQTFTPGRFRKRRPFVSNALGDGLVASRTMEAQRRTARFSLPLAT